ncbi:MAG: FHA domain-containing protein [Planctomycetaceae bacterium]|jgi:pSer/pThr/pTyr-binding forkhead associated (FHA) protein|nr:FHA domain-containing protein [Planctomycetaceae bacterium]
MALVTIRILDGPERGKTFEQVATPVSVGREDGNFIQLNDERVSRYHLKIHESGGTILLTDLQSTNGTKVNGEVVHTWRIKPGDLIIAGRSVLLFGSSEDIAERLAALRKTDVKDAAVMGSGSGEVRDMSLITGGGSSGNAKSSQMLFREIYQGFSPQELFPLQLLTLPALPKDLLPHQNAMLEEFLQYTHLRLRSLMSSVHAEPARADGKEGSTAFRITVSAPQWQNLVDFHARVAAMLDKFPETP